MQSYVGFLAKLLRDQFALFLILRDMMLNPERIADDIRSEATRAYSFLLATLLQNIGFSYFILAYGGDLSRKEVKRSLIFDSAIPGAQTLEIVLTLAMLATYFFTFSVVLRVFTRTGREGVFSSREAFAYAAYGSGITLFGNTASICVRYIVDVTGGDTLLFLRLFLVWVILAVAGNVQYLTVGKSLTRIGRRYLLLFQLVAAAIWIVGLMLLIILGVTLLAFVSPDALQQLIKESETAFPLFRN